MEQNGYENYEACMVLAAVGDAMGYNGGDWEFLTDGVRLHERMLKMTGNKGPLAINIDKDWIYSDDTVMHIATAKALQKVKKQTSVDQIAQWLAAEYKKCWVHMPGRAPGGTTKTSVFALDETGSNWNKIPFNERGGGCGGSMRSACIGLVFKDLNKLVAVALESGRITHHNPIAYLGSVVSSCFTFFALQKINPEIWGALLFEQVFKIAKEYVEKAGREVKKNLGDPWTYFVESWKSYLNLRGLSFDSKKPTAPKFPEKYGVEERDNFYRDVSFGGWGGASGHDSVIIAYDALLGCKGSWEQFCLRGILHGGDNDSTGTIGGAWFGALWGYKGVPDNHKNEVQNIDELKKLAASLQKVAKEM